MIIAIELGWLLAIVFFSIIVGMLIGANLVRGRGLR